MFSPFHLLLSLTDLSTVNAVTTGSEFCYFSVCICFCFLNICLILHSIFFSFAIFYHTGKFIHLMLIWNIFLSYLPLYISKKLSKKKSIGNILLWLVWLLFIPNTFYMITDFIHIQQIQFITSD